MNYKHFCSSCGKQYEDESKNSHTCPACREAKRKANQKASALSAKKRAKALGLVGALKKLAQENNTTIAEIVRSILAK